MVNSYLAFFIKQIQNAQLSFNQINAWLIIIEINEWPFDCFADIFFLLQLEYMLHQSTHCSLVYYYWNIWVLFNWPIFPELFLIRSDTPIVSFRELFQQDFYRLCVFGSGLPFQRADNLVLNPNPNPNPNKRVLVGFMGREPLGMVALQDGGPS